MYCFVAVASKKVQILSHDKRHSSHSSCRRDTNRVTSKIDYDARKVFHGRAQRDYIKITVCNSTTIISFLSARWFDCCCKIFCRHLFSCSGSRQTRESVITRQWVKSSGTALSLVTLLVLQLYEYTIRSYLIYNLHFIALFLDDETFTGVSLSESQAEKQSGNRKIKLAEIIVVGNPGSH